MSHSPDTRPPVAIRAVGGQAMLDLPDDVHGACDAVVRSPAAGEACADFVGGLLREQSALTAVDRFSRQQDATPLSARGGGHVPQRYYRQLMPATAPGPGQQFAFEVDLDSCSGCKACVVACHTLNGLEEHETWRRVGTLIGHNTIQHVTAACHHCEDPGCLKGCPVKAYVKDEATGVVRHLDDQCIGCKYCTMMCPYEVPQYSEHLGIVRKCDMCHQRLSVGEPPACVQACPNEAIRIQIVDRSTAGRDAIPVTALAADPVKRLAPGAPDSSITRPTTVYRTGRPAVIDATVAQDAASDSVAESHWPLAIMLVATQAAIGAVVIERLAAVGLHLTGSALPPTVSRSTATLAVVLAGLGMQIAPLHLGQPLKAWRVFLGLRTSWLSREAVILGGFMGLLTAAVVLLWLPLADAYVPEAVWAWIPPGLADALLIASIAAGVAGFYCSAMIYIATRRRMWRFGRTMLRFGGSAICLGLVGFALAASVSGQAISLAVLAAALALAALAAKLIFEATTHYAAGADDSASESARSARLVWGPLRPWLLGRCVTAVAGGLLVIVALLLLLAAGGGSGQRVDVVPWGSTVCLALALSALMAGEFAERWLYFTSVVYDRMPGMLR